jgi:lysophospholipase L1-like esterase
MKLLFALLCVQLFACLAGAEDAKPITILPLGDSITAGGGGGGGYYRHRLSEELRRAGIPVKFVGPKVDAKGLRHAGYGGWNSSQVREVVDEVYKQYPADFVLMHVGHNHFSEKMPIPQILEDTEAIVNAILKQNPHAIILLAQVVPAGKLPKYDYIPQLNQELLRWHQQRFRVSKPNVILVDHASSFDWTTDTVSDKVHPNEIGSEKMAKNWFAAIVSSLGNRKK